VTTCQTHNHPNANHFRSAFKRRRCIIPADGFFEWAKVEKPKSPTARKSTKLAVEKRPRWFHRKDGKPFVFAGLWERWQPESGDAIESCTIMTTEANEIVKPYHDRMPVILAGASIDRWLTPGDITPDAAAELLVPAPKNSLIEFEVSKIVNSPKTDNSACIEAVA
jgi:putative SOS response-associated peptidase YedK